MRYSQEIMRHAVEPVSIPVVEVVAEGQSPLSESKWAERKKGLQSELLRPFCLLIGIFLVCYVI